MDLRDPLTIAVNAVADAIALTGVPARSVRGATIDIECYPSGKRFVVTELHLGHVVRYPEDLPSNILEPEAGEA